MQRFVVRKAQLERFRDLASDELAKIVRDDLEAHHDDLVRGIGQVKFARRIQTGIEQANALGLTRKLTVSLYAELRFLLGPDFRHHPLFAPILQQNQSGADDRLLGAVESLTEEQWQSVRRRHQSGEWT